jgi:hypothetical protein
LKNGQNTPSVKKVVKFKKFDNIINICKFINNESLCSFAADNKKEKTENPLTEQ